MSDTWNGIGNWTNDGTLWSDAAAPTSSQTAEIASGTATLTATTTIAALQVDAPATAELLTGGSLTVTGTATTAGDIYLLNGASASVGGSLSLTGAGRVDLDPPFIGGTGGSTLSITGTLTNNSTDSNSIDVGWAGITSGTR